MSKTQKAKSTKGLRNDSRKNGKASKQRPGSRGSRGTKLDEGMKVLLGGGMLRGWERFDRDEKMKIKAKDRKKPQED